METIHATQNPSRHGPRNRIGAFGCNGPGAYPKKAVKFIAPYAVGDLPDTVAPVVAQCLTDRRGQAAVVNNKSGGNGVVACQALLKSNPSDGHAFIVSDGSMLSTHRRSTRPSKDC